LQASLSRCEPLLAGSFPVFGARVFRGWRCAPVRFQEGRRPTQGDCLYHGSCVINALTAGSRSPYACHQRREAAHMNHKILPPNPSRQQISRPIADVAPCTTMGADLVDTRWRILDCRFPIRLLIYLRLGGGRRRRAGAALLRRPGLLKLPLCPEHRACGDAGLGRRRTDRPVAAKGAICSIRLVLGTPMS
jgi:hypothetical protein